MNDLEIKEALDKLKASKLSWLYSAAENTGLDIRKEVLKVKKEVNDFIEKNIEPDSEGVK